MEQIKGIIWDWNGTLLNDMDICIRSMNVLLARRSLELLTVDRYREVFNFPVITYYKKIGFDFEKEPFEKPAREFIEEYEKNFLLAKLQPGAREALEYFKKKGIGQYMLSAMEQGQLLNTVSYFKIEKYFTELAGIDNHYANSKIERGNDLLRAKKLKPDELVLIGDTIHDYEVASALKCKCILLANGHHPENRLKELNVLLFKDLKDLIQHFDSFKSFASFA